MRLTNCLIGSSVAIVAVACAVAQESSVAREPIVAQGREVFMARCEYCHGQGLQKGGTMALQGRYQGAVPAVLDQRTNLTPEYIRAVVRTNTNGMSPIRITEVDEQQLDAVIAYLMRNNND